jgi:hypothetical protein
MPSLFFIRNTSLALSLLLLAGCAQYNPGWNNYSNPYNDPYSQSDFDELLAFGANMAKISSSSRAEVCNILLKRQKNSPGGGIQLHLMVGRLLSDSCGEIPRILNAVASLPPGNFYDERLQRLVAIHTETLKRMNNGSRKTGTTLVRKSKTAQPEAAIESKEAKGSKQDENRLLREKLEAIRSMEKTLDESGDAN